MLSRPSTLTRPHPPVRRTPRPFPVLVIDAVLDIQGSLHPVCPPHLPAFHCCTVPDCRRLYHGEPDACSPVLPHRLWPPSWGQALGVPNTPQVSFMWEISFSRLRTIVRFRYGPPVRSPPWLTRPTGHCVPASPQRLLHPSSLAQGHPCTSGICYGAKLGIAPAGLSPASTAARLAARPPKIPYVRFSRVRLQASGTHLEFGAEPSAAHAMVKADPTIPTASPSVCSVLRPCSLSVGAGL